MFGLFYKVYRVAGENASWVLDGNVLTISGTGEMYVELEAKFRFPVSTVAGAFSYSSSDNAWEPIRYRVKKIVICKGITGISENAFAHFDKLKAKVTGIKKKYVYNGKARKPKVTVKFGDRVLKKGTDYTVSYGIIFM